MNKCTMTNLGTLVTITVAILCLHVTVIVGEELNFYDDDGNVFTLTITGGCYNFKPKWDKRATAIEVDSGCYNVWDRHDCRGGQLRVQKGSRGIGDLKQVNFDKSISSINLCAPYEAEQEPTTNTGMAVVKTGESRPPRPSKASLREVQEVAVEEHNKYRARHGVPPLRGDEELHEEAQRYAEHLADTHRFEPSRTFRYGENLATSFRRNKVDAVKDAIKRWYEKIKNYDFERPGYNVDGMPSGSFSAVVWKNTTKLGTGIAWDEIEEGYIIVAFYEPQGWESSKLLELEGINSGKTCHLQFSNHFTRVAAVIVLLGIYNFAICSSNELLLCNA